MSTIKNLFQHGRLGLNMKPNVYREYFARWASLRSAPTYKTLRLGTTAAQTHFDK